MGFVTAGLIFQFYILRFKPGIDSGPTQQFTCSIFSWPLIWISFNDKIENKKRNWFKHLNFTNKILKVTLNTFWMTLLFPPSFKVKNCIPKSMVERNVISVLGETRLSVIIQQPVTLRNDKIFSNTVIFRWRKEQKLLKLTRPKIYPVTSLRFHQNYAVSHYFFFYIN